MASILLTLSIAQVMIFNLEIHQSITLKETIEAKLQGDWITVSPPPLIPNKNLIFKLSKIIRVSALLKLDT